VKRCRVCEQDLPLDAYGPRRARCRDCIRADGRAFYHSTAGKVVHRRNQKAGYLRAKEVLVACKQAPCTDCGGQFPPYVMHFDHRDPTKKKMAVSLFAGARNVPKMLAEIAKCDLVCANCHAVRTHRQREAGIIRPGRPRSIE
jgi:hypothetical protein